MDGTRSVNAKPRRGGKLLYGFEAIGSYLGLTERQAEYQAQINHLPILRMGPRRVAARPERLDDWLDELERQQTCASDG